VRLVIDGLAYPVIVSDAAPAVVAELARQRGNKVVIAADRAVSQRADAVTSALRSAGSTILACNLIAAGERRKQWASVSGLHDAWLGVGADRHITVVAIGGGTLTDVAGFAAATYLRGVAWLPVATTVLGMVDAAIGGKTGVNRKEGKNLIGSFWAPTGVVADLAALATLPRSQRRLGVAEAVKAAIVGDAFLLEELERIKIDAPPDVWGPVVAHAAAVKARIVAADPTDRDGRAVLNLGHTFAHAIEHASRYRVRHGEAVALGLRAAGILARDRTGWPQASHARVLRALRRAGLRLHAQLPLDAMLSSMLHDKKRADGQMRFVLPYALGDVRHGIEVPETAVRSALMELEKAPVKAGW
jgi:3-dehydroquinate synthetase